ncbi:temptin precursor [Elysia marginata]|uniref:Temptin n=1 Tax=Elysia marginata TaxID=1093978 RepID=A0AAV4F3P2_9GAST|nr:temptin precursor [Elysia marginata]
MCVWGWGVGGDKSGENTTFTGLDTDRPDAVCSQPKTRSSDDIKLRVSGDRLGFSDTGVATLWYTLLYSVVSALVGNLRFNIGEASPGVGHYNPQGTGANNAFGSHFVLAGRKWTEAFCNQDSDLDGLSNGEELGDPDCVWRVGEEPSRTDEITHPGTFAASHHTDR